MDALSVEEVKDSGGELQRLYKPKEVTAWVAGKPGRYPCFPFTLADFEPSPEPQTDLSERAETTYLNIIGGLLVLMGKTSGYAKQESIVRDLNKEFGGVSGLSRGTLVKKFAVANRSLQRAIMNVEVPKHKG
jgi:hypothetical protein